jgi:hypothetical protein
MKNELIQVLEMIIEKGNSIEISSLYSDTATIGCVISKGKEGEKNIIVTIRKESSLLDALKGYNQNIRFDITCNKHRMVFNGVVEASEHNIVLDSITAIEDKIEANNKTIQVSLYDELFKF